MRIIIDARFYGLENAGLGRYSMKLVDKIAKIDRNYDYILLLKKKYFDSLNYPSNFEKVLADFQHYSFSEQTKLPHLIKSLKPDLVHFLHFNVPIFYRGDFVVTIHDLLMHWQKGRDATTLPAPIYFTKRLAYKSVFRKAVLGSKKIIVPSQAVKKEVIVYYKINPEKVDVTYEGVDKLVASNLGSTNLFKKYKLVKPYFIYTGNAYPHKNLERAIKALVQLNKSVKVSFAIVSSRNVFTTRLEKIVRENKAHKFVKLLGFVPDDELSILYKYSTAFVYPSLSEGFGLPGLEAMASGTISLVSDIPVFREIYQDNAMYFDPYSVDSIVSALTKVLTLTKRGRHRLVLASRKFVERYSWTKMAEQTLEVYNSTI